MNHNVLLGNHSHERSALVKYRRHKSAECSQCSPGKGPSLRDTRLQQTVKVRLFSQLMAGKSVEMSQVQCLKCSYPAVGSDEMKEKKDERRI